MYYKDQELTAKTSKGFGDGSNKEMNLPFGPREKVILSEVLRENGKYFVKIKGYDTLWLDVLLFEKPEPLKIVSQTN